MNQQITAPKLAGAIAGGTIVVVGLARLASAGLGLLFIGLFVAFLLSARRGD